MSIFVHPSNFTFVKLELGAADTTSSGNLFQCSTVNNSLTEKNIFLYLVEISFCTISNCALSPHLKYSVQVSLWNPYLKKDIACLQKIQKMATKLVYGLEKKSYARRQEALGLNSLD